MSQSAAEQQQQQPVQQVRNPPLAPQHAVLQQHQQHTLLHHKQQLPLQQQQLPQPQQQQVMRMRSPFLEAQHLQDGTAFDTLAVQLLDALGQCRPTPGVQQNAQPAHQQAHSTPQHAHSMQQHAMHTQQQEEGAACKPHPLLPPAGGAAAAARKFGSAKLPPLGPNLQHWGSLEEGADADAQLPADADCAALVADLAVLCAAPGDTTAGSLAVSSAAAAAATAAVSPGDSAVSLSESASDAEHRCEVRALLESCLTEAAERARSESTQDSSAIASGLLLLREDSSLCSSCSISGATTEPGAVAIDWDAMLRSELFEAGLGSSNTDMHQEGLQPAGAKPAAAAAAAAAVAE